VYARQNQNEGIFEAQEQHQAGDDFDQAFAAKVRNMP